MRNSLYRYFKGSRKFTKTPSVQGVWTPGMWDVKKVPAAAN
jgi:hypothetical protein